MECAFKQYAFISYSHRDIKTAVRLQKKLEAFKLPTEIHNEFEDSQYLRPIFRDQTDLAGGTLSEELERQLRESKYLIVLCSRHSASSDWVNKEISLFIRWGRTRDIIPIIIDKDNDHQPFFPSAMVRHFRINPESELLGIDFTEGKTSQAFLKLVAHMLDISFDSLWQRHKRQQIRNIISYSSFTSILLIITLYLTVPVAMSIRIKDVPHSLPLPNDATVCFDGRSYNIPSIDTTIVIDDIPGFKRGHKMPLIFRATYYRDSRLIHSIVAIQINC